MAGRARNQQIDDDTVRLILLAPRGEGHDKIAARLGLKRGTVRCYRERRVPRALRIADELGLKRPLRGERALIARIMAGEE